MGLFGPNRKKSLWDSLSGMSDPSGPIDPGMTSSPGYDPSSDPRYSDTDPSIGSVGGPPKKGFNWGRAAMGFIGGPGVVSALRQKDALELQQQKYAEQQQQTMQNQLAAYQWAKSHGYSEDDARALAVHPETVAAMVQANHAPQHFDSGGGSVYQDGKFTIAPSERQLGRDIIRTDSDGNTNTVFSGIEPVPVQGMGVYGWNNKGPVNPGQGGAPPRPSAGGTMTDEQIAEMERRARGGAASGPRGFLGGRKRY